MRADRLFYSHYDYIIIILIKFNREMLNPREKKTSEIRYSTAGNTILLFVLHLLKFGHHHSNEYS